MSMAALGEPAVPLREHQHGEVVGVALDDGRGVGREQVVEQHARRPGRRAPLAITILERRAAPRGRGPATAAAAEGPTTTARAPMAASSRSSSRAGLSGLSGTATQAGAEHGEVGRRRSTSCWRHTMRDPVAGLEPEADQAAPQARRPARAARRRWWPGPG